jgi:hypothetical protein
VELRIDHGYRHVSVAPFRHVRVQPGLPERGMASSLARVTWTVAGRKSGHLVEKEKLGVIIGRKNRTADVGVCERAGHPCLVRPLPADLPSVVVKNSPVTHERAPVGLSMKLSGWVNAVLQGLARHRIFSSWINRTGHPLTPESLCVSVVRLTASPTAAKYGVAGKWD